MTFSIKYVIIVILLVCVLGFVILSGTRSEERKITKRLGALLELNEKTGSENNLNALVKARKASNFFLEDCAVDLPFGSKMVAGRDLLTGSIVQLRSQSNTISFSIRERTFTLASNEVSAEMGVKVKVTGNYINGDYNDLIKFYLEWEKVDGEWYIERVSIPEY